MGQHRGFDDAGIAPVRYTDRRRYRGTQAANFRRDAGKVTFSGPAVGHPLPPGAQDRLSWMLQLAAIAAAEPSLVGPGGRVSFLVVGARGDADVWTFIHGGEETLALPEGSAATVRLLREPGRAFRHESRSVAGSGSPLPAGARQAFQRVRQRRLAARAARGAAAALSAHGLEHGGVALSLQ